MTDSILQKTKKALNIPGELDVFDPEIIIHINSVFSTLQQLGIGPVQGFQIEDDQVEWSAFLADDLVLNNVKTYMYLRVRVLFDPPTTSFLMDAMKEQIKELEWRINVHREGLTWVDPTPPVPEV